LDDIKSAERTRDEEGRTAISIHFTKAGAEKMRKFSSEHIGKMAAIVYTGKVTNAPVIRSEISSSAVISFGAAGLSDEDAQRILEGINPR
jgi:preprotein translocase subunit SecD